MGYCCEMMQYHSTNHCPIHNSPYDCPDWIIVRDEARDIYGIVIHDGGHSSIRIKYCPWCGAKLSQSGDSSKPLNSTGDGSMERR